MGWIGCAIYQVTFKGLTGFFFRFNILIFIYFFKYETISTFAPTFWTHIISELGGVPQLTPLTESVIVQQRRKPLSLSFFFSFLTQHSTAQSFLYSNFLRMGSTPYKGSDFQYIFDEMEC